MSPAAFWSISAASGSSTVDAMRLERMSRSRTNQRCISVSTSGTDGVGERSQREHQRYQKAE